MSGADTDLHRIVATVRPAGSVTATGSIERGRRKRTSVVRFDDAAPIVVQRAADRRTVRTEVAVLRALAGTAVPVPRVLASGETGGDAWVAVPFVDGDDLHGGFGDLSPARRRAVVADFGRYLATIHRTLRFDRRGPVDVVDGRLATTSVETPVGVAATDSPVSNAADPGWGPPPSTDDAWLSAYGRAHVARLPAPFDALRSRLVETLSAASTTPDPRLFPWDLRPGNALVSDGAVTAVLDWEAPLAADPALAVAKTEYLTADWYRPVRPSADLRAAFREGYRSIRPLPTVDPAHRVAAVASSAVDSAGVVTTPGYPPVDREAAVAFHRRALDRAIDGET